MKILQYKNEFDYYKFITGFTSDNAYSNGLYAHKALEANEENIKEFKDRFGDRYDLFSIEYEDGRLKYWTKEKV